MKARYTLHPAPQSGKIDLLEQWVLEARWHSSSLNPRPLYKRRAIRMIEECLRSSFPKSFFVHEFGLDGAAWDVNPILRMLLQPKKSGMVKALLETCHLIRYAQEKQPLLHHELLQQLSNPVKFQATLYEAYIAFRLTGPRLNYKCDSYAEGVPLDGTFEFDQRTYRVECKQPFSPKSEELDVLRRVVNKVSDELGRVGVYGGYGLAVRLTRPAKTTALAEADDLIRSAIQNLSRHKQNQASEIKSPSGALTIDLLPLGTLDPGKTSSDTELVARIEINPEGHTAADTSMAFAHFSWSFTYSQDAIVNRLRDIIQRARKQHHQRDSETLLICVDSPELDDFRLGLFQANDGLAETETRNRIHSVLNNCIVLVTRRIYTGRKVIHRAYIFNNPEDQRLAEHIKGIFAPKA